MTGSRLPDLARPAGQAGGATPRIEAGSWWRAAEGSALDALPFPEGHRRPGHGVVLLVTALHVIDGEIHSVTLLDHPARGALTSRLLIADFLRDFSPEPDGAALRAREMSDLMERIQAIGARMADVPPDHLLLEGVEGRPAPAEDARIDRRVPAALLPGGDVAIARARIEHGIQVMEARRAWIEARAEEMRASMDISARFQKERVSETLAGISQAREQADSLLKNVHSMNLWLGEGVETAEILAGRGAAADEPLHFYQRLLYLDEEIHVDRLMNRNSRERGFSVGDMKDLPEILKANPGIVKRMLPTPRSVAIARIRRRERSFPESRSVAEALQNMFETQADKRVMIFARDGGNLKIILADDETSSAKRLFPSASEIDAIFTRRNAWNREEGRYEAREITQEDLTYVEARQAHDDRALHYKRFLLILWGLHEREGLFGDFLPPDTNWLSGTVHEAAFRFVHDDENVLTDGRPSVKEFIAEANAWIRPGSTVAIDGRISMTPETTPAAWKVERGKDLQIKEAIEDVSILPVVRRGALLASSLPVRDRFSVPERESNTPFILRDAEGQLPHKGVLCLDQVRAEDLRHYIESRIAREDYLDWLSLFSRALEVVEARDRTVDALSSCLDAERPDTPGLNAVLARAWIEAGKTIPETDRERDALLALVNRAERLLEKVDIQGSSRLVLAVSGKPRIERLPSSPVLSALACPVMEVSDVRIRRGNPGPGGQQLRFSTGAPAIGEVTLISRLPEERIREHFSRTIGGTADPRMVDTLLGLESEDAALADQDAFLEPLRNPQALSELIGKATRWSRDAKGQAVIFPRWAVPVALAVTPRSGIDMDQWQERWMTRRSAILVWLSVDILSFAARAGHRDDVRKFTEGTCAKPFSVFQRIMAGAGSGEPADLLRLRMAHLHAGEDHDFHATGPRFVVSAGDRLMPMEKLVSGPRNDASAWRSWSPGTDLLAALCARSWIRSERRGENGEEGFIINGPTVGLVRENSIAQMHKAIAASRIFERHAFSPLVEAILAGRAPDGLIGRPDRPETEGPSR